MASQQVDGAVIQRTKDTLGKVIKKPPLTDKLLSRPPFRYLHDIISEVIRNTGFLRGLYTPQELDVKAIQDRDAKIAFLQKAIDALSFTTGDLVRVKPSKVVSGHEAEKTNELLQVLSIAILKKQDSSEAVKRVLRGEKPSDTLGKDRKRSKGKEQGMENGERTSESKEGEGSKRSDSKERDASRRSGSKEKEGSRRSGSKERDSRENDSRRSKDGAGRTKPRDSSKGSSTDSPSLTSKSSRNLQEKVDTLTDRPQHRPSRRRPDIGEEAQAPPTSEPQQNHVEGAEGGDDEGMGSETKLDRPLSAKGRRKRPPPPSEVNGTVTSDPVTEGELGAEATVPPDNESHDSHMTTANRSPSPPPAGLVPAPRRPSTARPAPPKIVKNSSNEDVSARIPSGHAAAPPMVIMDRPGDNEGEEEEEEGQYVVEDPTPLEPTAYTDTLLLEGASDQPEGALTKKMVATKEHLEGDLGKSEASPSFPTISEAQRRKEREMVSREIERLQSSIQTLCRSANPLGKIMDYVQEDMDSMQKELESWRGENDRHAEALMKEESITEQELSPLRAQLEELDTRIQEQADLISATKATILKNEEKIQQMLNSLAFSST